MPSFVSSALLLLAQAPAAEGSSMPGYLRLLAALAILIVPFVLGVALARQLRMRDYGWKIGVVLFALAFGAGVTYFGWPPKLGVDLSGGVILVYQVDPQQKETNKSVDMDELISALSLRINPSGVREITIRAFGPEQVEIIIPNVSEDEARRIEQRISSIGTLEFRILANNRDHASLIERAEKSGSADKLFDAQGNLLAWWVPVREGEEQSFATYGEIARREREVRGAKMTEILVVNDPYNVTGAYLDEASEGYDERGGPAVLFTFNSNGAKLFSELTGKNLPEDQGFTRKLGIILDGFLYSAPAIQSTISNRGQITGSFTQEEVQDLVNVLNAGSLPAALTPEPISRLVVGPTLGRDTIRRSANAMIISSILVPLFMIWYYRFSGLVAIFALVINILVLVGLMITFQAAFTLSGLAGLALTVGMAVDNNVLVYERLREERERGATIRMAIRNAFHRAAATIVDANLTTLIVASVLYAIGTDQVKGFAVALWLGVAISMFTAIFVSRVVFDIWEKQRWLTQLKMLRVIGETHIDFMRLFVPAAAASVVVIVLGLSAVFARGSGLFDIDFTGGVSVQMVFREEQKTDTVRAAVEQPGPNQLPSVVVTDVRVGDEAAGRRFLINTSEESLVEVERKLTSIFGEKLDTNNLQVRNEAPIATTEADVQPTESAEATAGDANDRFAGGTRAQLVFEQAVGYTTVDDLFQQALAAEKLPADTTYDISNVAYRPGDSASYNDWELKTGLAPDVAKKVFGVMAAELRETPFFPQSSTIGVAVAGDTQRKAFYALAASWLGILAYLWIRFQGAAFGVAAVVALIHDVLIMVAAVAGSYFIARIPGVSSLLMIDPFKINLPMVAAFLTIIGYSVNDTIIVFDRIRETRGKLPTVTPKMVNDSVNQTLSRTLITSFTVLLVVVVLYIVGGEALRGFAFALIIGVISGTYSSVYVASPVLLFLISPRHANAIGSESSRPSAA
ncbi:MAG: protein translocase subunit SecD [Planctomycetota bacterium]